MVKQNIFYLTGSSGPTVKLDTSNHHHIFVGDLSTEIDNDTLRNAFSPFGEISDCKVVKDPQTIKSKGIFFSPCLLVNSVLSFDAVNPHRFIPFPATTF